MKKITTPSKKEIIFLILSIIIVGFIAFSFTHYGNAKTYDAPNTEPTAILDYSNISEMSNCKIEDGKLVATDSGAYVTYKLPANDIKSFKINFFEFPHSDISRYINIKYSEDYEIDTCANIAKIKDKDINYLVFRTEGKPLSEIKVNLSDDIYVYKNIELFNQDLAINSIYIQSSVKIQIFVYIAALLLVIALWYINRKTNFFARIIDCIVKNKKRLIFVCIAIVASLLASFIICWIISILAKSNFNIYVMLFVACVLLAIVSIYRIVKSKELKIELIFVCISLIAGFAMIAVSPIGQTGMDMDSHVRWATGLSNADGYANQPERDVVKQTNKFWPLNNLNDNMDTLKRINEGSDIVISTFPRDIQLPHVPGNIVFCVSRQFNLDFNTTYNLTKLMYLILYTLVCYFAIKKLKSGKRIMTVIALFPQCLFLATTISYDWWVISFMLLGFSYFFYEKQQPKKELKLSNAFIMCGSFFLACLPKQAYILCMLLPFLINKKEFKSNKKKKRIFYLIIIGSVCLLMFTLLLRTVTTFSAGGDTRGGSNVNSIGQIKYILNNPLIFGNMLLEYVYSRLSIFSWGEITSSYGYIGLGFGSEIIILLFIFTIITDKNHFDKYSSTKSTRIFIILGFLASVTFIAASFYIVFSEVGAGTINGFQYRYIIPLLFPIAAVISSCKIKNSIKEKHYDLGISITIYTVMFIQIGQIMLTKMI